MVRVNKKRTQPEPGWIETDIWADRTTRDRHRLDLRAAKAGNDVEREWVREAAARSAAITRQRRGRQSRGGTASNLPITEHAGAIVDALEKHQVAVVCGETGSGKTTQLPRILMGAGWGARGQIGHTQPRRLAARSVAERIAEELEQGPGDLAGYVTRFDKQVSKATQIKVMTDGVLLAEIARDRYLTRYEAVIIDEAHERTLNVDFLLGYLKRLLPHRPDLKVIVTSATIDPERFATFFDDAPVINVEGRSYPVTTEYRPPAGDVSLPEAIESAVDELWREAPGDVLVFLPGERDIRDAERHLAHAPSLTARSGLEIVPLYARLTRTAQNRVFAPGSGRRIVLATNVAETSLTVPNIRYVVDSGLARISRYSSTARVQQLPIEPVSRASCRQRAGRCGRVAPGICIRLFSEDDFEARPAFTEPEIQRTNLASVLLTMADLKLGSIESFDFMDPPAHRHIKDGRNLLQQLGALTSNQVTALGRRLARLPLDPRLGRMVLAGADTQSATALRIVAAGLTINDPRERPPDARAEADTAHAEFADNRSDFVSLLKLWDAFAAARTNYGGSQVRQWCRKRYLNFLRLREWEDLVRQLRQTVHELGSDTHPVNGELAATDYQHLHEAILTGLVDHVGFLADKPEYRGIRNRRFRIFPGSSVAGRTPKWIVAVQFIETSRVFAHFVAAVEPAWIENAASHLTATEHYHPFWSKRRGQVLVRERVRLFGLTLIDKRRRNFAVLDPEAARRIFIDEALQPYAVADRRGRLPAFLQHNQEQIKAVTAEEARLRRNDLLIDEASQAELYAERLPQDIRDRKTLFAWLAKHNDSRLRFSLEDLKRDGAPAAEAADYPESLELGGLRASVRYRFEPGSVDDGVTVRVPLAALNDISLTAAAWNVPGYMTELFTEYLRALPKRLRRDLVPIPDTARAAAAYASAGVEQPASALRDALRAVRNVEMPADVWSEFEPSPHLKPRFEIVDEDGRIIDADRDLRALRSRLGERAAAALRRQAGSDFAQHGLTAWPCVDLSEDVDVAPGGVSLSATPILKDRGDCVDLTLSPIGEAAVNTHRQGVIRLVRLALNRTARRLKRERIGVKALRDAELPEPPATALVTRAYWHTLNVDPEPFVGADMFTAAISMEMDDTPRTHSAYDDLIARCTRRFEDNAVAIWTYFEPLIQQRRALLERLNTHWPESAASALADMREQLDHLVYVGTLGQTGEPIHKTRDLARYLHGIDIRLDKLARSGATADRELSDQVLPYWQYYKSLAIADGPNTDPNVLRWLIEEFRIQLFAQALGTEAKVSRRRLDRLIGAG